MQASSVTCGIPLKQRIDTCWARAHYYGNWAFRTLESNPFALEAMSLMMPGYQPPGRRRIGNELLESDYQLAMSESARECVDATYVSIVTDGWSNIRYEGLTNILITTPVPFLYKVIDDSLQRKTGEHLAKGILEAVHHFGYEKVAGVVTDNAANMKKMWKLIQHQYPRIVCSGCAAHTMNLMFGDIFTIGSFSIQWDQVTYTFDAL